MPPAGFGRDFAYRYANEIETYDRYIGGVALSIAVDMRSTNAAYCQLISDADLRRRMGEAGRKRARAIYDWRVVIAAYQDLWAELAARRSRADPNTVARAQLKHINARDPFALFAPHASTSVSLHHRIRWANGGPADALETLFAQPLANYALNVILGAADCRNLVEAIRAESGREIGEIVEAFPVARRMHAFRTLLWLAKFGLVEIDPPAAPALPEESL